MKRLLLIIPFLFFGFVSQAQIVFQTNYKSEADKIIYQTNYKSEADVIIYKTNYKSEVGY